MYVYVYAGLGAGAEGHPKPPSPEPFSHVLRDTLSPQALMWALKHTRTATAIATPPPMSPPLPPPLPRRSTTSRAWLVSPGPLAQEAGGGQGVAARPPTSQAPPPPPPPRQGGGPRLPGPGQRGQQPHQLHRPAGAVGRGRGGWGGRRWVAGQQVESTRGGGLVGLKLRGSGVSVMA